MTKDHLSLTVMHDMGAGFLLAMGAWHEWLPPIAMGVGAIYYLVEIGERVHRWFTKEKDSDE